MTLYIIYQGRRPYACLELAAPSFARHVRVTTRHRRGTMHEEDQIRGREYERWRVVLRG